MSKPNEGNTRETVINVLKIASHSMTPFISVFLVTHLAPPILTNIGGSRLASQTMVFGREYYQGKYTESLLVFGPIGVHALSGITKRLLRTTFKSKKSETEKPQEENRDTPHRPFKSLLAVTGWAMYLLLFPIHVFVHRNNPALPIEPIASVGPSSLDFEYVKYGLHNFPWRSWLLYGTLVGSLAAHWADGSVVLWNTWLPEYNKLSRATRRKLAFGGIVVPVFFGLVALAREPPMITSFLANRYKAAFSQSFVFRFF